MAGIVLSIGVEVKDRETLYRIARSRAKREPGDDREAVVMALVGDDLGKYASGTGLAVWHALARWEEAT
jgi:hypothetical protein